MSSAQEHLSVTHFSSEGQNGECSKRGGGAAGVLVTPKTRRQSPVCGNQPGWRQQREYIHSASGSTSHGLENFRRSFPSKMVKLLYL